MVEDLLSVTRTEVQPLPGVSIVRTAPASVTLTVFGDVDRFGAPILGAALDVVWDGDPRDLVVDLTDVTFLGVSGLHVLVRARQTAEQRSARLTVRTSSRHIERLLASAEVNAAAAVGDVPGRGWWEATPEDDPLLTHASPRRNTKPAVLAARAAETGEL